MRELQDSAPKQGRQKMSPGSWLTSALLHPHNGYWGSQFSSSRKPNHPYFTYVCSHFTACESNLGLGIGILNLRLMFGTSALRQAREDIPWQSSCYRLVLVSNRQLWFLVPGVRTGILSSAFVIHNKGNKILSALVQRGGPAYNVPVFFSYYHILLGCELWT